MFKTFATCATLLAGAIAMSTNNMKLQGREDLVGSSLKVDLNYMVYEGYKDAPSGLNIWKGWVDRSIPRYSEKRHWPTLQNPLCSRSRWWPTLEGAANPSEKSNYTTGFNIRTNMPSSLPCGPRCARYSRKRRLFVPQCVCTRAHWPVDQATSVGLDTWWWIWIRGWNAEYDGDYSGEQQGLCGRGNSI